MDIYPNENDVLSLVTQQLSIPVQPVTQSVIAPAPMVNQIPGYVYRLTCIPTGQFYIGSRVGNITIKKMPKDDFWIHYHTSSDYVSELVKVHGKSSFEYEIIYEDCDRDKVFWYEQEQIRLHIKDPLILNIQFNGFKDKHKGTTIPRSNSGKHRRWKVTSPCGVTLIVSNLERYCKDNKLDPETMRGLARGKGKQYKGFKCSLVPELSRPDWFVTTKIGEYIEPIPLIEKVSSIHLGVVVTKQLVFNFKHKEKTESLLSQYRKRSAAKPKPVKKQKVSNPALQAAAAKTQETQRKNGTQQNGSKACILANRKTWEITDPVGKVYVTDDLAGFCKANNLTYQGMIDVSVGRQHSHRRGWKCNQIASNKPALRWEMVDPAGNVMITDDIKLFCKNNGLSEASMRSVALGHHGSHRGGWKCKRLD